MKQTIKIYLEPEDLKREAIKWVKELGETTENENTEENVEVSNWIKHFFNLTEEDFKEGEKSE